MRVQKSISVEKRLTVSANALFGSWVVSIVKICPNTRASSSDGLNVSKISAINPQNVFPLNLRISIKVRF